MSDGRLSVPPAPRRAHWAYIVIRTFKIWQGLAAAVVAIAFSSAQIPAEWRPAALITLAGIALISGPGFATLSWFRFSYELTATELRVNEGMLFRKQAFIPGRRVHAVDISAGLIERMLGVVSVRVQTAGGSGSAPEAIIQGITLAEAEAMRAALLGMGRTPAAPIAGTAAAASTIFTGAVEQLAGPINEFRGLVAGDSAESGAPDFEYRLDTKGMLLAATTSGRTWLVLAAIIAFGTEALDLIGGEALFDRIGVLGVAAIVVLAVGMVALSWLASVVTTMLEYSGFTVRRRGTRLEIERGLLEHRVVSLSLDRIQAVRVHQGMFRRLFGYCELHVDTAGFAATGDDAKQSRTILHPFLRVSEARVLMDRALPGFSDEPVLVGLPGRAVGFYVARWVAPILLLSVVTGMAIPDGWGWLVVLGAIPAVLAGVADHSASAWGMTRSTLAVRTGLLGVTTRYIPRQRVQAFAISQGPMQRPTRLASVHVSIVSGGSGQEITLSYVDVAQAHAMQDWFDPGRSQEGLRSSETA